MLRTLVHRLTLYGRQRTPDVSFPPLTFTGDAESMRRLTARALGVLGAITLPFVIAFGGLALARVVESAALSALTLLGVLALLPATLVVVPWLVVTAVVRTR